MDIECILWKSHLAEHQQLMWLQGRRHLEEQPAVQPAGGREESLLALSVSPLPAVDPAAGGGAAGGAGRREGRGTDLHT